MCRCVLHGLHGRRHYALPSPWPPPPPLPMDMIAPPVVSVLGEQRCGVELLYRKSTLLCTANVTFGAAGGQQMWVARGCRGTFRCCGMVLNCGAYNRLATMCRCVSSSKPLVATPSRRAEHLVVVSIASTTRQSRWRLGGCGVLCKGRDQLKASSWWARIGFIGLDGWTVMPPSVLRCANTMALHDSTTLLRSYHLQLNQLSPHTSTFILTIRSSRWSRP